MMPFHIAAADQHSQVPLATSMGAGSGGGSGTGSGEMGSFSSADMLLLAQHQNMILSGMVGQLRSNEGFIPGLLQLGTQQQQQHQRQNQYQQVQQQLQSQQHNQEMGMMPQLGLYMPSGPGVNQLLQPFHHQQQEQQENPQPLDEPSISRNTSSGGHHHEWKSKGRRLLLCGK